MRIAGVLADCLLVAFGAILYTVAIPPAGWSLAGWFALTPLMLLARRHDARWAALGGFAYGTLISAGVAGWLRGAISTYFNLAPPSGFLLTFAAYGYYVGTYTALGAAGWSLLMRWERPVLRWVSVPALWVGIEFARATLLAGFSWELLGYTVYRDIRLIQIADITGVWGLSFLIAFTSYVVAELVAAVIPGGEWFGFKRRFSLVPPVAATASIALVLLYGQIRLINWSDTKSSDSASVALVRTNPSDAKRFQRMRYASNMAEYVRLTEAAVAPGRVDLVVWPEFALSFYLDHEPVVRAQLGVLARSLRSALLIGAPRFNSATGRARVYNSAFFFSADGTLEGYYDKIRLLPFAEYQPAIAPAIAARVPEDPSGFSAGDRSVVFDLPSTTFGVLICYEVTYPSLARRLTLAGAQFLVNISNDSWLTKEGDAAALQHFSMAVFRAVENKRTVALSTIRGISGFVSPVGRPYSVSGEGRGVIIGSVPLGHKLTIYTRLGDWFAWLCSALAVAAVVGSRWERA
ncbi:MAG TPA: apolipoprotein N-acyltransferase [Candidatus Binataceae bacterium]|nr:apolipoprotein N-acyltransferase [Candidatus Binataceae bacterium]